MALTARERKFVDVYLVSGNATKSAESAGYSKRSAGELGHRLLKKVEIKAAIVERQQRVTDKAIATRAERQEFWSATMRDQEERIPYRLKASELLGKSERDFEDAASALIVYAPRVVIFRPPSHAD